MSASSPTTAATTHLGPERTRLWLQAAGGITVLGAVLSIAAAYADLHRFAYSYLTGFVFVTTLGLGGLFFVLLQHVTQAGWSVGVRRQAEWISGILPIAALLFLPIAYLAPTIFQAWVTPDKNAVGYEMLARKGAYLNLPFFYARAIVYFIIWAALSLTFRAKSLRQDKTSDPELTKQMQKLSPVSLYLFAFSLTFAAFDWMMSLLPAWYSTIFGVYVFAGSATSSLALLCLMIIVIQKSAPMGNVSTIEHRQVTGNLLFGFTVFWAYIAFDQFFLIWYANIPDETIFYKMRWGNSWEPMSYLIIFGHFWVPFLVLLSRHAKRSIPVLTLGATIMLVMHYVDMYWLVMPNYSKDFHFSWIDLAGLLGPVGVLAWWLAYRASQDAVYPLGDPRLPENALMVSQ